MESRVHNVANWIAHWAANAGDRAAVVDASRSLSYRALAERVARLSGWLRRQGITPGDRVAVMLRNGSPFLESILAIAQVGAISLPINWRLSPREIAFLLTDSGCSLVFHEEEFAETIDSACRKADRAEPIRLATGGTNCAYERALGEGAPDRKIHPVSPETGMTLMYTSGTTGEPKGALLPHRKTLFNSLNAQLYFGIRRADRVLVITPLFHSLGLNIISLPALYAGACVHLQSGSDEEAIWRCIQRDRIHYMGGVPTQYQKLLDLIETRAATNGPSAAPDSLRFLFTAGAAIPVELVYRYHDHGLVLSQGYGQTESSVIACLYAEDAVRKAGSVGRTVAHAAVRVVDRETVDRPPEQWRTGAPGEIGEIVVRGPITMLGYWNRPSASAEVLRDGWLRTTDLGSLDDEGFLTLAGRARDMIISGGENVYPAEVEEIFSQHPDIREIAVVGVPDERWGEAGRAHVVLERGSTLEPQALRDWALAHLASFKIPREFRVEKDLPRTASGKVRKHLLQRDIEA